jgi:hypothetical protein
MEGDWLLVQADDRPRGVVGLRVELQDILHGRDKRTAHPGQAPLLVSPRLQFVFWCTCRTVSGEMPST